MNWQAPQKPSAWAEARLIEAILDGDFPAGSNLPAERDLAERLGVTRPTLREALQRLARDGWVEIRHGLPTRVRDYWREGQLAVLVAMVERPERMPEDTVPNLLEVRQAMAPVYTAQAVARNPRAVCDLLAPYPDLPDTPADFTAADWQLHHALSVLSGNPVYTLMLNGFRGLYAAMGLRYFALPDARAASRAFYAALFEAASRADMRVAEQVTRAMMAHSLAYWKRAVAAAGDGQSRPEEQPPAGSP